jgi:hypothetical protein
MQFQLSTHLSLVPIPRRLQKTSRLFPIQIAPDAHCAGPCWRVAGASEFFLFSQQLEHFSPGQNQTFLERFAIDTRFMDFPFEIQDMRMINKSSPFSYSVLEIAKAADAAMVAFELRCFCDGSANSFCSVSQILADHAFFLDWLTRNATSLVIVVGGGYNDILPHGCA